MLKIYQNSLKNAAMRYRFFESCRGLLMLFAGIGSRDAPIGNFYPPFHLDFRTEVMMLDAMKRPFRSISERGINTLVME